jgi:hypothetical protein
MLLHTTNQSHSENSHTDDTHSEEDDNEDADICVDDDIDEGMEGGKSTPCLQTSQGMYLHWISFLF